MVGQVPDLPHFFYCRTTISDRHAMFPAVS
jgi:hypothetical protein